MSNNLDPDLSRCSLGPDLGPNCLQRFSADDKSHSCFVFFTGTDRAVQIPDDLDLGEKNREENATSHVTSVRDILHDPPEGVITLGNQQGAEVTVEQSEADSTLDFYS